MSCLIETVTLESQNTPMSHNLSKKAIHCFKNECLMQNIVIWCAFRIEISRLSDIGVLSHRSF